MEVGGILERMFRLPENFAVPNVLYVEELEEHHPELLGLGLSVLEINENYMREAYRLGDLYKKIGHHDVLALALAKQEQCPLLTGDLYLREAANSEEVSICGTLWIVERLFELEIIDYDTAANAYTLMRDEGRRLPWDKVEQQLQRFSDT